MRLVSGSAAQAGLSLQRKGSRFAILSAVALTACVLASCSASHSHAPSNSAVPSSHLTLTTNSGSDTTAVPTPDPTPLASRDITAPFAAPDYVLKPADTTVPLIAQKPLSLNSPDVECRGHKFTPRTSLTSGSIEQFSVSSGPAGPEGITSASLVFNADADAIGFYNFIVSCISLGEPSKLPVPADLGAVASGFATPAEGYPAYTFIWVRGTVVSSLVVQGASPSVADATNLALYQASAAP